LRGASSAAAMWSKILEEEKEAPAEMPSVQELHVTTRSGHVSRSGRSSRCHGMRVSITAFFMVLVVVAAAVILTHVPHAWPLIADNTKTVGKMETADNSNQQLEEDVERDVNKDVDNFEHQAEQIFDTVIKSDVSGPATQQKLEAKLKQDIRRDLGKFTEEEIKKVVDRDVKRDVSPVLRNYESAEVIGIPSLEPKLKKQLDRLWPSLFCWCIMQTVGNNPMGWSEETLIKQQLERGIGISACNEWAVMTDEPRALNRWGPQGFPKIPKGISSNSDAPSWAIGSTTVAKGVQTNPLNSLPFENAWKALKTSGRLTKHDWVIKVDPDTVWFPTRLRTHLKTYMPGHGNGRDNIFIKNCPRFNSLQGPLEVISRQGAINLENNIQNCGGIWGTGEDHFIVTCLKQLGVPSVMEPGMLNDKYCDGYVDCANSFKVAFHPHKNPKRFMECFNTSKKAEQQTQSVSMKK